MTAQELLKIEMNEAEYQLGKVLEGLDEDRADAKPLATVMSPREQVEHLSEVYVAAAEQAAGQAHDWGSYSVPDRCWRPMLDEMWKLRASAAEAILAGDDTLGTKILAGTPSRIAA